MPTLVKCRGCLQYTTQPFIFMYRQLKPFLTCDAGGPVDPCIATVAAAADTCGLQPAAVMGMTADAILEVCAEGDCMQQIENQLADCSQAADLVTASTIASFQLVGASCKLAGATCEESDLAAMRAACCPDQSWTHQDRPCEAPACDALVRPRTAGCGRIACQRAPHEGRA